VRVKAQYKLPDKKISERARHFNTFAKDNRYNPLRVDDMTVVSILFLAGMTVFLVYIQVPKAFHDQLYLWPFRKILTYKQVFDASAGLFTGLALMIASSMYLTAMYAKTMGAINTVKADRTTGSKTRADDTGMFDRVLDAFAGTGGSKWKFAILSGLFVLIMIRVILAYMSDHRSACVRTITGVPNDLPFNIILIVFLGIDVIVSFYLLFAYLLNTANVTGNTKGLDIWDIAIRENCQLQTFGSYTPAHGAMGFQLFYILRWLAECYGVVLLSMDVMAYQVDNVAKTDPILKGLGVFVVILAFFTYQSFLYYSNQHRSLRHVSDDSTEAMAIHQMWELGLKARKEKEGTLEKWSSECNAVRRFYGANPQTVFVENPCPCCCSPEEALCRRAEALHVGRFLRKQHRDQYGLSRYG